MNDQNSVRGATAYLEEPQSYEWAFPGSPVRILLKLDLVPQLLDHVALGFDADSGRPVEVGGLLLGIQGPHGPEIVSFEPIGCERNCDSFVTIVKRDKLKLQEAINRYNQPGSPARVIGCFRSNLRENLSLDSEDFALIQEFFDHPSHVFLLVQHGCDVDPTGAFFFWSDGQVAEESFMPFPFNREILQSYAEAALVRASHPDEAESQAVEPSHKQPVTRKHIVTAALLSVSLIVAVYVSFSFQKKTNAASTTAPVAPAASAVPDAGHIGLSANLRRTDLTIAWDPDSQTVKDARVGVLVVKDENGQKEVPLTAVMLQAGKLLYRPKGKTVTVSMEVFTQSGKSAREVFIALLGDSPRSNHSPAAPLTSSLNTADPASPRIDPPTFKLQPSANAPAQVPTALLLDAPPALETKLPSRAPGPLPFSTELQTPRFEAPAPAVPPAPAATQQPAVVEAPAPKQPAPAPLLPPKPVQQVRPELSASLRGMVHREAQVQVRVTVDSTGKVVDASPLPGKGAVASYLQKAATNAARMWRFEPARLNGNPVPGELVLEFRFLPEK